MENRKKALGKGLEQLFNNENLDMESFEQKVYESVSKDEIINVNLSDLRPNPYQPRKQFDEDALEELSESIKEHGVFQPIIIKKSIKGYEIIAGERRVRASKLAGLQTIPAIIKDFDDEQMMEIALLENLQREDLNAIEEAKAYKSIIDNLGITQEQLSKKMGKSRSHVTNMIGLLRLPTEIQQMVLDNKISMGHARVISKYEDSEKALKLAKLVVKDNLSVRDLETFNNINEKDKVQKNKVEYNTQYEHVEETLKDKFDTKVKIKDNKIIISFTNNADLNRILDIINLGEYDD